MEEGSGPGAYAAGERVGEMPKTLCSSRDHEVVEMGTQAVSTPLRDEAGGGQGEEEARLEASAEQAPIPEAPDGGLQAWLQVLGGFVIYFNTWGLMISFGVFQTYYQDHLLAASSPSAIAWIGTMQAFFLIEVGVVTGPLYDQGYCRHILLVGTVLLVLGVALTSVATRYWSVFLSLGVCTGIGMGCLFFPGVTSISTYFTRRRGLAGGLAAAGSGVGAIVYPIVLRQLVAAASFPWAVRAVALIVLVTSLVPLLAVRPLWLPSARRRLLDRAAFRGDGSSIFAFWSLANVVGWVGLQAPIFYANAFAQNVVSLSQADAFYVSAVLGAGSLPGRLLTALASDRLGPLWVYPACMALAGVISLAWIGVRNYAGLMVVVVLYGFAYGGISSLPPAAIAALSPDVATLGTRIGTSFSVAGFAMLVGPPIAGAIEQRGRGAAAGYEGMFGFAGAVTAAGSLLLFYAALLQRRHVRAGSTTNKESE